MAKAATDGPWHVDGGSEVRGRARDYAGGEPGILVVRHTWAPEAAHIARHDPSRVLREVQAKRAILDLYEASLTYSNAEDEGRSWLLAEVVRHFAAVYADHPDYDEAWRP